MEDYSSPKALARFLDREVKVTLKNTLKCIIICSHCHYCLTLLLISTYFCSTWDVPIRLLLFIYFCPRYESLNVSTCAHNLPLVRLLTVLFMDRSLSNRGVTVHKYDSSVCTSDLTSRFGMISVHQGKK